MRIKAEQIRKEMSKWHVNPDCAKMLRGGYTLKGSLQKRIRAPG